MTGPCDSGHIGPEICHLAHTVRYTLDLAVAHVADDDVTGLRGRVLGYIVRCTELGGDVYQRDIEAKFHIQRSSVTTLLQGMEAAGLVLRLPVPEDARLKRLVPTRKGLACQEQVQQVIDGFEHSLQQGLRPAELETLRGLLQRLLANLEQMQADLGEHRTIHD